VLASRPQVRPRSQLPLWFYTCQAIALAWERRWGLAVGRNFAAPDTKQAFKTQAQAQAVKRIEPRAPSPSPREQRAPCVSASARLDISHCPLARVIAW
jgi:hypothetical protein